MSTQSRDSVTWDQESDRSISEESTTYDRQWVCTTCGYNMMGEMPDVCPFCGAHHHKFVAGEKAEQIYRVTPHPVNNYVTQLLSVPRLGFEHAAYRIETEDGAVWIDCPSAFNRDLEPVDAIYFTHKDFLGASNQYRELWNAKVYLHALDAQHPLARSVPVDQPFNGDFTEHGIEAFHIGGHSPGFMMYIYGKVLFICDYAFPTGSKMQLNPFGPQDETRDRAARILEIISERSLETVCGFNFITEFDNWREDFKRLLDQAREIK
jgi:hydroxyacylglutathione hydrolase